MVEVELAELVGNTKLLDDGGKRLTEFLGNHRTVFCLEDLSEWRQAWSRLHVLTRDAAPKQLLVRLMPFVVRHVVNCLPTQEHAGRWHNSAMSSSPWACPVVMV